MKITPPYLTKKTLDNLNCGVYSYNVLGEPDLYINKFSLNQLGDLNKVYKTSITDIISRVIHPLDQGTCIKAVKSISSNADQLYIHFGRFLIKSNQYKWMFVIHGANEITEEGNTKRIISFAKFVDHEFDNIQEWKERLELIGFNICPESLTVQLGNSLNYLLFNILEIKDKNTRVKELHKVLQELREKINLPAEWELDKIDHFFKVFPALKFVAS